MLGMRVMYGISMETVALVGEVLFLNMLFSLIVWKLLLIEKFRHFWTLLRFTNET